MLLTWQTSQTPLNGLRVGCATPNRKPKRASKYIKIFHFKLRLFARNNSVQNNWKESCFSARASRQSKKMWQTHCSQDDKSLKICDMTSELCISQVWHTVRISWQSQGCWRASTAPNESKNFDWVIIGIWYSEIAASSSENVLKIWRSTWNQLR